MSYQTDKERKSDTIRAILNLEENLDNLEGHVLTNYQEIQDLKKLVLVLQNAFTKHVSKND